jgi:RNA 3'-terminal phosphate cyclase
MNKLQSILGELGATPDQVGYQAACACIELMIEDPYLGEKFQKRLYPAAAERLGTTDYAVERGIRYMLGNMQASQAFLERLRSVGRRYKAPFLLTQFGERDNVTTKEFITTIAYVLGDTWDEEADPE